ncbi:MAG: glycosyltransferase, partial [Alphaproteobacteria bacterium]
DNRGLAGARNSGIRSASGEYIYFLDADDIMFPHCLETLSGLLDEDREAIAACSGVKLMGGKQHGTEWRASYNPYSLLVQNSWAAGIMLRKHGVEKLSLWYDESMRHGYEDWEFNIRLTQAGCPPRIFPGALYYYRIHPQSMLTASRRRHAELVSYIRDKHQNIYAAENLLHLKRLHDPALAVATRSTETDETEHWLAVQKFQDCILVAEGNQPVISRYLLLHPGVGALQRLPPEALESAIMSLESNVRGQSCVLAVRLNGSVSSLGAAWRQEVCQPVAIVLRSPSSPESPSVEDIVEDIIDKPDVLLRFADQSPSCESGWKPIDTSALADRVWNLRDPVAIRKRLSRWGEKLFGARLKAYCVTLYDFIYYRLLFAETTRSVRERLAQILGDRGEYVVARIFYGFFLATPQSTAHPSAGPASTLQSPNLAPLFLTPANSHSKKITLLIATAWLNQGGIEQEIVDLCKHLDSSRFSVVVATTKRSAHPWETLIRNFHASVYHLADFLNPRQIRYGLAHLILNHNIDVLHIIHSREAYEALPLIKQICPYLCVSDRNVTFAGGFPKISAKVGGLGVEVRTVGNSLLAQQMSDNYGLQPGAFKVIHAGTDLRALEKALSRSTGRLHEMCKLSPDVPIVLFMGRLDREKRPHVFVQTAAKIFKMCPDHPVHFAMVGNGEMRDYVEASVRRLGLSGRFHLLGFRLERYALIFDSTLLMITSAYEGLALVSFEAMAVGTPQISADVGGQRELITPETGILVKNGRGEVGRYAGACLELLADPERRARMAAAGKERIKNHFTAENAVKQYAEIFEQMAELSRKRATEIPHLRPPHINPLREL